MYLKLVLPSYDTGDDNKKWAWINKIGLALINEIRLEIGGTLVDRQTGDWLNLWNELTKNIGTSKSFDIMVGNTTELTTLNRSHASAQLFVPLRFFFNRHVSNALPLIALQYHEVKVYLKCNSVKDLVVVTANVGDSIYTNGVERVSGALICEYVFLDLAERQAFASNPHEYLIEQTQLPAKEYVSSGSINARLNFNHPTKEIIWFTKLLKFVNPNNKTFLAYSSSSDELIISATKKFALRCALLLKTAGTPVTPGPPLVTNVFVTLDEP
jgi:hypothetical protein